MLGVGMRGGLLGVGVVLVVVLSLMAGSEAEAPVANYMANFFDSSPLLAAPSQRHSSAPYGWTEQGSPYHYSTLYHAPQHKIDKGSYSGGPSYYQKKGKKAPYHSRQKGYKGYSSRPRADEDEEEEEEEVQGEEEEGEGGGGDGHAYQFHYEGKAKHGKGKYRREGVNHNHKGYKSKGHKGYKKYPKYGAGDEEEGQEEEEGEEPSEDEREEGGYKSTKYGHGKRRKYPTKSKDSRDYGNGKGGYSKGWGKYPQKYSHTHPEDGSGYKSVLDMGGYEGYNPQLGFQAHGWTNTMLGGYDDYGYNLQSSDSKGQPQIQYRGPSSGYSAPSMSEHTPHGYGGYVSSSLPTSPTYGDYVKAGTKKPSNGYGENPYMTFGPTINYETKGNGVFTPSKGPFIKGSSPTEATSTGSKGRSWSKSRSRGESEFPVEYYRTRGGGWGRNPTPLTPMQGYNYQYSTIGVPNAGAKGGRGRPRTVTENGDSERPYNWDNDAWTVAH